MKTMDSSGKARCAIYEPITWSESDTNQTIRQVKIHNRVWMEDCE